MIVCTGRVKSGGRFLGFGEEVPDIADWSAHSIRVQKQSGNIREVTPEEVPAMRQQQADADARSASKRLHREVERCTRKASSASRAVSELADQLALAQTQLKAAEDKQLAAELALEGVPELPPERKPVPPPKKIDPVLPVPKESPPVASPEELRAKALVVLGAYSRPQLVKKMDDWYGVDISGPGPKLAVRERAVTVYLTCQPAVEKAKAAHTGSTKGSARAEALKAAGLGAWAAYEKARKARKKT